MPKSLISIFATVIIAAGLVCSSKIEAAAADNPPIINGSIGDEENDSPCSEVELMQYIDKIKKQIKEKWQPVKGFSDRHVTVIFTIEQNGAIDDAKIIESGGSQAVDQSALAALKLASPLPPLPKGAPQSIQIRYVFDWRVNRN